MIDARGGNNERSRRGEVRVLSIPEGWPAI